MRSIDVTGVPREELVGRAIHRVIGRDAALGSDVMTVGLARYSAASGGMEPHRHAEEVIYVVAARDAWVRYGNAPNYLAERFDLRAGLFLHIPESEWHVFEQGDNGFADCLFIYGQVENIRPDDPPIVR